MAVYTFLQNQAFDFGRLHVILVGPIYVVLDRDFYTTSLTTILVSNIIYNICDPCNAHRLYMICILNGNRFFFFFINSYLVSNAFERSFYFLNADTHTFTMTEYWFLCCLGRLPEISYSRIILSLTKYKYLNVFVLFKDFINNICGR